LGHLIGLDLSRDQNQPIRSRYKRIETYVTEISWLHYNKGMIGGMIVIWRS